HTARFKLEDAGSESRVKNLLVGFLVGQRNFFERDLFPASLCDKLQCVIKNGKRGQPQKIHLEQTQFFYGHHVERSNNFVVLRFVEGHQLIERTRRNHYPGGVDSRISNESFQFLRCIQERTNLPIILVSLLQLWRIGKRLLERYVQH